MVSNTTTDWGCFSLITQLIYPHVKSCVVPEVFRSERKTAALQEVFVEQLIKPLRELVSQQIHLARLQLSRNQLIVYLSTDN